VPHQAFLRLRLLHQHMIQQQHQALPELVNHPGWRLQICTQLPEKTRRQ